MLLLLLMMMIMMMQGCLWYGDFHGEFRQTVRFLIYFNGNYFFITDSNTVLFTS